MPFGEVLVGAVLLSLTVGSSLAFALVVTRRRLPELSGTPRALAFGLLAFVCFFAIHLVPGALGVLGKASVTVCALLVLVGAILVPSRPAAGGAPAFPPAPPSSRFSWALAAIGAGAVAVYWLAHAVDQGGVAAQQVDMTTFHLPGVARWIQSGTYWQIDQLQPHWSNGTYPNTSDVVLLGAILPFDSDFLVRLVNYPALVMTAAATYALARELSAPAAPSVLFGALFVAFPIVTTWAVDGLADTLMLAGFGAGILFLLRQRRTRARADLVLAGIGLGLSLGTKWYAATAMAVVVGVWVVAGLVERKGWRTVLGQAAAMTGIVAAVGGFWLLRNWVELGNPLYPVEVRLGGVTVFDAPRDLPREMGGRTLAGYLDDPTVWRRVLWPNLLYVMSWGAMLVWLALPVCGALALARRRASDARESGAVFLCLVIAAGVATAYLLTPYSAMGFDGQPSLAGVNARYVAPALLLAAALAAWGSGRLGRARPLLELLALAGLVDAVRRNPSVPPSAVAVGVVAVAAGATLAILVARQRARETLWRSPRAFAAAAASVVLLFVALVVQERRFNDDRYARAEAPTRWVNAHAPAGRRIGIVGEGGGAYSMFGPRLGNEVEYVGPVVEGTLRTYDRRPGFEDALRRGRYDFVLVHAVGLVQPTLHVRQERWLRGLGYELVASGVQATAVPQPVRLYRAPRGS
jgi:hypothetical protein